MRNELAWLVILSVFAVPFVVVGLAMLREHRRFARIGVRSHGHVVAVEAVLLLDGVVVSEEEEAADGRRAATSHFVEIAYEGPDGATIQRRFDMDAEITPLYSVGERIEVRYLPDVPTRYRIVGDDSDRYAGICCLIVAVELVGVGAVLSLT